jgi:hypothetical protein
MIPTARVEAPDRAEIKQLQARKNSANSGAIDPQDEQGNAIPV